VSISPSASSNAAERLLEARVSIFRTTYYPVLPVNENQRAEFGLLRNESNLRRISNTGLYCNAPQPTPRLPSVLCFALRNPPPRVSDRRFAFRGRWLRCRLWCSGHFLFARGKLFAPCSTYLMLCCADA
jgi:hypothetical protein